MSVIAESKVVCAFAHYIRLCLGIVVRSKEVLVYREFNGFSSLRINQLSLVECNELDCRLFNLVGLFVVAVRGLSVYFNYGLACNAASILYADGDSECSVVVLLNIIERLGECGIRKAIAEGIGNFVSIIPGVALGSPDTNVGACVALIEDYVFIAGFVILIANVNALLIYNVVYAVETLSVMPCATSFLFVVGEFTEVYHRGEESELVAYVSTSLPEGFAAPVSRSGTPRKPVLLPDPPIHIAASTP